LDLKELGLKLIARIALRLHEIGTKGEADAQSHPEKSVAIFRVLGNSPDKALKALDSEISLSLRPLVALAVPEIAMTEGQAKVYEAVVSACHFQLTKVYACGGDPEKLHGQGSAGSGADKWFSSVPAMLQAFGEPESRYAKGAM
jgi:hypothetical protein